MKKQELSNLGYFLIVLLLFAGCKKDDDSGNNNPSVESQIIVSPDEILINDNETSKIFLSIQPPSGFEWNVSAKPDWIDINPASGMINDQIVELQITPDPTGLSQGKHFGEIEIITNGAGKAEATIQLCVDPHPLAAVEPGTIVYSANESEKVLTISNIGTGFLSWNLESLPDWINVNIVSGVLDEGQSVQVVASAQRNGLPVGTETGQAVLVSNSEEGNINIDFTLEVPPSAIMSISTSSLNFGYFEDSETFYIKNEGNTSFDWSWDNNSNAFLSANPGSGALSVGDSVAVTLSIDRTDLVSQTYNVEILINNDEGQSLSLPVQINHFQEEKWLIEGRVIDAEYDRNNNVIVVVSETPNEIRTFDPINNSMATLALDVSPLCVSVSQDGNHAVVGFNGGFVYVDLNTMEVIDNYAVTTNPFDIVLAPNNWVYVIPAQGQWVRIKCINLSTGVETDHTGSSVRHQTKIKLHPSGDYIYGADNGLSPSDFEKYDITGGTATYLYDSPYHGTYAFSGNIWIAEDGNRLFARSRNVFNSTTTQSSDMTYNGMLVGEGSVTTLDFSADAEIVYAILTSGSSWSGTPASEITKYETDFLSLQGTIPLPRFLIPDGSGGGTFYDSQGHFGFFNAAGTKFHVVVKVEDGSGAQNEWAIATVDVE